MPDDTSTALSAIAAAPVSLDEVIGANLPVSLRMMLDERMYDKVKQLAGVMSKAEGFTPKHLIAKPEACFVVISCALNWKMDPHFVARCTYQTPGGSIGFEGKLVQAIIEQSGRLDGGVQYEWTGDWTRLVGKYQIVTGGSGKSYYPKATWTPQDAIGLGVIVRAQIRGEREKRVWPAEGQPFQLTQCFPLNSPLWATDPKTQIAYLAVRRFANQAVPQLLGGMAFDEDELLDASERARDVTPIAAHAAEMARVIEPEPWAVYDYAGNRYEFKTAESAAEAFRKVLIAAAAQEGEALKTAWDNNYGDDLLLGRISEGLFSPLNRLYDELAPQDSPAPDQSQQKGEAAFLADGNGPQPNSDQPAGDTSAPDEPAQRSAADPSTQAPAAERPYQEPRDEARAETPPAAASGEEKAPAAAVSSVVVDNPGSGYDPSRFQPQTADRHDPFWDRDSLRIEPPTSRTGKPDYKAWSALIIPRIRQAWTVPLVNELMTANQDVIDLYASNFGSRARDELTGLFEDAKNRLAP